MDLWIWYDDSSSEDDIFEINDDATFDEATFNVISSTVADMLDDSCSTSAGFVTIRASIQLSNVIMHIPNKREWIFFMEIGFFLAWNYMFVSVDCFRVVCDISEQIQNIPMYWT